MSGFMITLEGNGRGWYLGGTVFFLILGIVLTIVGFASAGVGLGVVGVVIALGAAVLMIDAIMNYG